MAVASKYTRFLRDEFDSSGESSNLEVSLTVNPLKDTGFQNEAETYVAGLSESSISQGGYYSGKGAGYIEQEIQSRLGTATAVYVAALFGTNTAACPAYVTALTWGQQMNIDMPLDNLIQLKSNWPASGGLIRGLRLTSVATQTITGIGTLASVDLGAQGTAGWKGFLFVQSISGSATNATIDFESSATEGGAYASEGTASFSAVGVQVVTFSGTVDRWIRLNVTSMGGATNFVIVAVAGTSGVTY